MESCHELMLGFEWNRVEPVKLATDIGIRESCLLSRNDQRRFCRIAFYANFAIVADEHGVVAEQPGTKTR